MSREAMQIALDALEANLGNWAAKTKAVEVLRQALETEQEPVATVTSESGNPNLSMSWWHEPALPVGTKIYTSPQPNKQWVGLEDEQVEDEWERITGHSIFGGDRSEGRAMHISPDEVIEFSRAIEVKLKEKNT